MLTPEMRELFRAWMQRRGSDVPSDELFRQWEALPAEDREMLLREVYDAFEAGEAILSDDQSLRLFDRIRASIRLQEDEADNERNDANGTNDNRFNPEGGKVVRLYPRRWRLAAVAAAVLLIVTGWWLWHGHTVPGEPTVVVADIKPPAANRATLTLAGGRTITLDSAANGTLATQGAIQVKKTQDLIEYVPATAAQGGAVQTVQTSYNTLFNPRGSRVIHVVLADGSTVWLNASSTLRYPVSFSGPDRRVEVNGEAFFDVAANPRPFIVSKGGMAITVLGTRFNVNAYDDEAAVRVTLLAGKVRVASGVDSVALRPGQQAVAGAGVGLREGIDLDQVTAWMNDRFDFGEGTDLADIMRQVARWYDVDIRYNAPVRERFGGGISREVNVSKVLDKLTLTGRVHFRIEGRTIVVGP